MKAARERFAEQEVCKGGNQAEANQRTHGCITTTHASFVITASSCYTAHFRCSCVNSITVHKAAHKTVHKTTKRKYGRATAQPSDS